MDDLNTTLIDVYETLRFQQDLLTQTAVKFQALMSVMMGFEQVPERYAALEAQVSTGEIAQQAALIRLAIEQKLQALRAEAGLPDDRGTVH